MLGVCSLWIEAFGSSNIQHNGAAIINLHGTPDRIIHIPIGNREKLQSGLMVVKDNVGTNKELRTELSPETSGLSSKKRCLSEKVKQRLYVFIELTTLCLYVLFSQE